MRADRWKLRDRLSERQNGGAVESCVVGRASTSLWVMRWICQFCEPKVNTWPVEASQTNSSSSSPTAAPVSAWRS
jgi:hypothetical protein